MKFYTDKRTYITASLNKEDPKYISLPLNFNTVQQLNKKHKLDQIILRNEMLQDFKSDSTELGDVLRYLQKKGIDTEWVISHLKQSGSGEYYEPVFFESCSQNGNLNENT